MPDAAARPADCAILEEMGFDGRLTLPLRRGETTIGTLCLGTRLNSSIQPNAQLLSSLANQAAIAAEHVRLHQQTQQLAVLEERDRIAREMHDGLAQILGFISAKTQAARAMLASDQENQAIQALEHVQQVSQEAYADVRECILGLKTGISPGRGLWPTLAEYLRKYRLQTGIQAALILADGAEQARLSPAVEVQLLGIIQEALTNVRKHARATDAWIRVATEQDRLQVKITDNGCGFNPQTPAINAALTFGLQNMRERAKSVGGTFEIQSSLQQGTTIVVQMPLAAAELVL